MFDGHLYGFARGRDHAIPLREFVKRLINDFRGGMYVAKIPYCFASVHPKGACAGAGKELPTDWETLIDSNSGRLEWLEYNLKRVLGMDCGDDERQTGIDQAEAAIRHIVYYTKMRQQILENCYKNAI